jgi:hypothetical protein
LAGSSDLQAEKQKSLEYHLKVLNLEQELKNMEELMSEFSKQNSAKYETSIQMLNQQLLEEKELVLKNLFIISFFSSNQRKLK